MFNYIENAVDIAAYHQFLLRPIAMSVFDRLPRWNIGSISGPWNIGVGVPRGLLALSLVGATTFGRATAPYFIPADMSRGN